jgi:hypothetical protein
LYLGHTVSSEKEISRQMTSSIFWDIRPCSPTEVNWRFERIYFLRLQGPEVCHAKRPAWSRLLVLILWEWRRYDSPKRRLTFTGLRGAISQKTELFTATADGTSNAAQRMIFLSFSQQSLIEVMADVRVLLRLTKSVSCAYNSSVSLSVVGMQLVHTQALLVHQLCLYLVSIWSNHQLRYLQQAVMIK